MRLQWWWLILVLVNFTTSMLRLIMIKSTTWFEPGMIFSDIGTFELSGQQGAGVEDRQRWESSSLALQRPGFKFSGFHYCLRSVHICDDHVRLNAIKGLDGNNATFVLSFNFDTFTQILLSISADLLRWWVFHILTCIHQSWRKK